ncbi:hypothetical protein L7F22_052290 [Adiantum nelumboides]|nr:hypothetical protein [Adiantum nelumboides]
MLKEECQSLQLQQDSTNTQLETVKNELKEESRLRLYVQKEGQEFKEQAMKAREEIAVLHDKFFQDVASQNTVLKEARELHVAAMNQCEALQDEILRLREDHSAELQDLAERAGKEADYNVNLMNKMDNTLHQHDHLYMEEINKLHMRLSEESQQKEDALREMERQRSLALTAEENWLREKDAHEQALKNTAGLTAEMHSLQIEVEKLMKQLSRVKKSHAGELEELEKIVLYHKEIASRADQEKLDFTAERKQLVENIRLLEEKGRVLEKKLELERLQFSETVQNELMKATRDRTTRAYAALAMLERVVIIHIVRSLARSAGCSTLWSRIERPQILMLAGVIGSKPSVPHDIVRAEFGASPMVVEALFQIVGYLHRLRDMRADRLPPLVLEAFRELADSGAQR